MSLKMLDMNNKKFMKLKYDESFSELSAKSLINELDLDYLILLNEQGKVIKRIHKEKSLSIQNLKAGYCFVLAGVFYLIAILMFLFNPYR